MRIIDGLKSNFAPTLIGMCLLITIVVYILFHLPIGSLQKAWSAQTEGSINAYAISPSGSWVALGQTDGTLIIYQQDGSVYATHSFQDPIRKILFSLDESLVYVNTSVVSCYHVTEKKVIWQKFKKDFSVENFWLYRNQQLGFLFSSKFNLNRLYTHTDKKGMTLHEFSLPEMFERYRVETTENGLYVILIQSNGDIQLFQTSNGFTLWNDHLDPPVIEDSILFPVLADVNDTGYSIIAYTASDYGKTAYIAMILDPKGEHVWKTRSESAFQSVQFAQDSSKWLLSTDQATQVLDLKGQILFQRKQYGYTPVWSAIGNTTILVGYNAYKTSSDDSLQGTIIKLFTLAKEEVLWQKKILVESGEYQVNRTGNVLLEVIKPNTTNLYRWTDKNFIRKVCLWLF